MATKVLTREIVPHGAPMGRPSIKSDWIVGEIVRRMAFGETMSSICRDDAMPSYPTVWRWSTEDADFREQVAHARRCGTHARADECLEIADNRTIPVDDRKVSIETRLKLIGKWNSLDYGERTKTDVNVRIASVTLPTPEMTADEASRAYQALIKGE